MSRFLHHRLMAAACALLTTTAALAQNYPAKPIRIVVPQAPGGGNDTIARMIGQKLTGTLRQQVLIENRPGAGGLIAAATHRGESVASSWLGLLAVLLASINIFGGFAVTARMLAMYKKNEKK